MEKMSTGGKVAIGALVVAALSGVLYLLFKPSKASAKTIGGKTPTKPGQPGYVPGTTATPDSQTVPQQIGQTVSGSSQDVFTQKLVDNANLNMQDVTSSGGSQADGYRTWIASFYNTWSPYTGQMSDADATTMYSYLSQQYGSGGKPSNSLFNSASALTKKYNLPTSGTAFA